MVCRNGLIIFFCISFVSILDKVNAWVGITTHRHLSKKTFSSSHSLAIVPLAAEPLTTRIHRQRYHRNKEMELFSSNYNEQGLVGRTASLADKYVVELETKENNSSENQSKKFVWSLYSISIIVEGMNVISEGEQARLALFLPNLPSNVSEKPVLVLECTLVESDHLKVLMSRSSSDDDAVDSTLQKVLARILVQWASSQLCKSDDSAVDRHIQNWRISLEEEGNDESPITADFTSNKGFDVLFKPIFDTSSPSFEWVEMVSGNGKILGRLPRPLVHKYNLLHRGIGLFVTKDRPMLTPSGDRTDFPDLYVHRRVDNKRIFPSLYDMFVGGVSVAEEDAHLTARREVAEELGLSMALSENNTMSGPILDCAVCTSYNRCLVTLFHYTFNSKLENVSWQEEEVAWGDFVSYPVIAAAADRSIQRLAEKRSWPGSYPPIQSAWNGELQQEADSAQSEAHDWGAWDFVPDGLLVWDAWLNWLEREAHSK